MVTGVEKLQLSDSENEEPKQQVMTAEDRRKQIQRVREEKQRQYEEARGRIFGTPDAESGASSPGCVTPPRDRSANKGKGKGRAANVGQDVSRPSSAEKGKQLYDPGYSSKPESVYLQKREKSESKVNDDIFLAPIRQPRQPDGSRGFTNRGGRSAH